MNDPIESAMYAISQIFLLPVLLAISLTLLGFWATEGKLHNLDTASSTIAGIALLSAFLILIHQGFACATALTASLLPIIAPQNMVCLGTEAFTSRQFTHVGIWLTVTGYALTWWPLLGLI